MPEYNDAARNAFADVLQSTFGGGSLDLLDASSNVLATITLPATAFSTASGGSVTKEGTWSTTGAVAAGSGTAAASARMTGGSAVMTLTVGGTGSGAEVIISNSIDGVADDVIVENNPVTVDSFSYTHPAS